MLSTNMKNERGYVLAYVLIFAVIVLFIAAGLTQMLLSRYTISARVASSTAGKKQAEGSLNRVITAWNANNAVCSNVPGFICNGTAGTCRCDCLPVPVCTCGGPASCPATVSADPDPSNGLCKLTIQTCP